MNLADKISLLRILLAPCVVASLVYYQPGREVLRFVALALFLIGMLSDAVDGFIARSQRQQSQLGTILDPLADKFLILSALISLSTIHALPEWMRIPAWFNLIVISRDVVLVAGTLLIFAFTNQWSVRPSRLGKWTILAQMLVIPTALLGLPGKGVLLIVAAALTIVSGIGYLRMGTKVLGAS